MVDFNFYTIDNELMQRVEIFYPPWYPMISRPSLLNFSFFFTDMYFSQKIVDKLSNHIQ